MSEKQSSNYENDEYEEVSKQVIPEESALSAGPKSSDVPITSMDAS